MKELFLIYEELKRNGGSCARLGFKVGILDIKLVSL